jgi:Fe-S cluster assembly ATP-binding protein
MAKPTLKIENLHVQVEGKRILKGVDLVINYGEIHAIMGPNGSGKSSLCNTLMGHPNYKITRGKVTFNGKNLLKLSVDERAKMGLFLGFQYPREVPGVTFGNFMRIAVNTIGKAHSSTYQPIAPAPFYKVMQEALDDVKMPTAFIGRSLNDGFSGGEKKRAEIVQMSLLKPKMALLDEIDSGLDIDALKTVSAGIKKVFGETEMGLLLVTHYQRILSYLKPDHVHIMADGKIVKSGGASLAKKLEKEGYSNYI